jgi:hypothetical protein
MKVRKNQRWEEMDKSAVPLETLFANYALYNRSEGKAASTISGHPKAFPEPAGKARVR